MVLESLYMTEFEAINREYPNIQVKLVFPTVPEGAQHMVAEEYIFDVTLICTLPAEYPDVLPELEIQGIEEHLGEAASTTLLHELKAIAEQNLGMPSVYAVASELADKIEKLVKRTAENKANAEYEAARKAEEDAFKEYEAGRVTVESFNEWRKEFEAEMKHLRDAAKKARMAKTEGRLTGRQMFLQDQLLSLSDLKLVEEADADGKLDEPDNSKVVVDGVEVDESLFTDDVEIPDSDEED
uniref:RWD domain-containing protein n=2 Tax=Panagrellus redivivus TaxID=6233 RepID=A0A7E4V6L1_PANRE